MPPSVTEEQWLQAADIRSMDARWIAQHDASKWDLFAAACCRRVLALGPDPLLESLIDATQEFAHSARTWKEKAALRKRFCDEYHLPPRQARKVAFELSRPCCRCAGFSSIRWKCMSIGQSDSGSGR